MLRKRDRLDNRVFQVLPTSLSVPGSWHPDWDSPGPLRGLRAAASVPLAQSVAQLGDVLTWPPDHHNHP